MKTSSQTIVLSTLLAALLTLDVADAAESKLFRKTRRENDRKRNLIKVDSGMEELVQMNESDLTRALMGDMSMSMSMSMPSYGGPSYSGGGGKSDDGDGSTSDGSTSDGSTTDGSTTDGSSTDGSTTDGSSTDGGDTDEDGGDETSSGDSERSTGEEDLSAAPMRRNFGVAAVAATAMVVPLLL